MVFNWWRRFPRFKPKGDGCYLCTIKTQELNDDYDYGYSYYVKTLYYYPDGDFWLDTSRQSVFDGYKVYKSCRATIEENRVHTDSLCIRDDVIAWKKLPKHYKPKRGR